MIPRVHSDAHASAYDARVWDPGTLRKVKLGLTSAKRILWGINRIKWIYYRQVETAACT